MSPFHQDKKELWLTYYIFGLDFWLFSVCIHKKKECNQSKIGVKKALLHVILYCSSIISFSNLLFQLRFSNTAPIYPRVWPVLAFPLLLESLSSQQRLCTVIFIPCPWVKLNWEVINIFNNFWLDRIRNWPPQEWKAIAWRSLTDSLLK